MSPTSPTSPMSTCRHRYPLQVSNSSSSAPAASVEETAETSGSVEQWQPEPQLIEFEARDLRKNTCGGNFGIQKWLVWGGIDMIQTKIEQNIAFFLFLGGGGE